MEILNGWLESGTQLQKDYAQSQLAMIAAADETLDVYGKLNEEALAWVESLEEEQSRLEILNEWLATGTQTQQDFARAQLASIDASNEAVDTYQKLNEEVLAHAENLEDLHKRLEIMTEWLNTGTEAQKAFAEANIDGTKAAMKAAEHLGKQTDELDVLTKGFEGFFDNLSHGAADVEEVFKRSVQSIIAELLKLWAMRSIWNSFGVSIFGYKPAATGLVFDYPDVLPFAQGGVITSPIRFPMALAGEAGPEAIMPLRRTASGDLGVQASQPVVNVTVNNTASNLVGVSVNHRGNDLEVIIEQTRDAIASDFARGGNRVSHSLESAYGIGRGSASAF